MGTACCTGFQQPRSVRNPRPEAELVPKIEKKLSEGMPPPEEYDYVPKVGNDASELPGDSEVEANDI